MVIWRRDKINSTKRIRSAILIILLIGLFGNLSALISSALNSDVLVFSSIFLVIAIILNIYLMVKE